VSEVVTKPQEDNGFTPTPLKPAVSVKARKHANHDSPAFNEGFRLLALNVRRLLGEIGPWTLVVLSARPGEGRSTTAASLAAALARLAPPVVLIDADPDGSGVSAVAAGWHDSEEVRGGKPRLQVVNPWHASGTPEAFLDSVQEAIQDALDSGAKVIVDAPACSGSSAGFYLATSADGVLYVTRPNASKDGGMHGEVRAQLDLLRARVLGVVVNEG